MVSARHRKVAERTARTAIAAAALVVTCVAMQDQWYRYARVPHRWPRRTA